MACFPLAMTHLSSASAQASTNNNTTQAQSPLPFAAARNSFFDPARAEEVIRINGGYELVIAPLFKRFLAEVIDTLILFIVKILFFVFFLDYLDIHL
jgi:hypothetical protein